jgi:hypothetical protein
MEDKRLKLHDILCEIVSITEPDGDRHTYFQPPPEVSNNGPTITYPAIVYSLNGIDNKHANNEVYGQSHSFKVIVIDYDSDSPIAAKVSRLRGCRFDTSYTKDHLNHFVYTLNY